MKPLSFPHTSHSEPIQAGYDFSFSVKVNSKGESWSSERGVVRIREKIEESKEK